MAVMTISEVAHRAGIRPSAIRYYESIGLLQPTTRVSGQRRYDEGILERLAIIQTAQQAGFTLSELRVLLEDILTGESPASEWHALIRRKLQELNTLLLNVQEMKQLLEDIMDCDDSALAECILSTGQRHRLLSHGE